MIREVENKRLEVPDRKEITLCEAVTAFVYGIAIDTLSHSLNNEAATDQQSAKARSLIERLHSAAYAGRIKFRGLRNGADDADGHKDIDNLYFRERRGLRWEADQIWSGAPYRRFPDFRPRPPHFVMEWHDVHLDRKDFEALLRDEGVPIQQSADALDKQTTYATGAPGRPTSRHFVEPEAERILDNGHRPKNLTVFSNELAKWLRTTYPKAVPMTSKAIQNAIRKMYNKRLKPPKIIDHF
jgi:hypothetical protein